MFVSEPLDTYHVAEVQAKRQLTRTYVDSMPASDFDDKQAKIIRAWTFRSRDSQLDPYDRFISQWIAFNAYCCGLYARSANRNRADLKKDSGLQEVTENETPTAGIISRNESGVTIQLTQPGRIIIQIREKYTEDIVFGEFAKGCQVAYQVWLETPLFKTQVSALQAALNKQGLHYVINMAKIDRYDHTRPLEMAQQNVIVRFEDTSSLAVLIDVLYQIRCNVFHGEKAPGDINDDKIVAAAAPVLHGILEHLLRTLPDEIGG